MIESPATMPCPRCGRPCPREGGMAINNVPMPIAIYCCEHCIVPWHFGEGVFDTALMFVLTADGRMLDAATWEPIEPTATN
jgi:hypothetical protein